MSQFCLNQQNKSSASKVKFRQTSNCCKRVLKAAKLTYANKKESITSQKLGLQFANSVLNKSKPPIFNRPEVLSSPSDKTKLFGETFSTNSNLDDSGISLPVCVCPSGTNLILLNIHVTPKLVKQVIDSLD